MLQMNRPELIYEIYQRWIVAFKDTVFALHEKSEDANNRQTGVQLDRVDRAVVGQANCGTDSNGYKRPRNKLRRIVKAVILALYAPEGPPAWMKFTTIVEEVNERLVTGGYWPKAVHSNTIKRALGELGDQYNRAEPKVRRA
jgi:hypothetical protein